jgi:putative NAD(P)-binding protein
MLGIKIAESTVGRLTSMDSSSRSEVNRFYLTGHKRPGERQRVCIVGPGVSGLVAAKVFLSCRYDVVVIEMGPQIGGVWSPSKSYPGARTQPPVIFIAIATFQCLRHTLNSPRGAGL